LIINYLSLINHDLIKKDLAIAIYLGASNLRVSLISKKGKFLKYLKTKTPQKGNSGIVITKKIISLIESLLDDKSKKEIARIGINSIGPLDYESQKVLDSPNIPFKNIPLAKPLKEYFNLPVYLSNDCSSAVWGEKIFGTGEEYKNLVYITISSGIGTGAIVDNHLLGGHNHNAAEVGHFIVDTKYNLLCGCKKGYGHWESYCSGNNLPHFFKYWLKFNKIKRKYPINTSSDIFALAGKADKIVLKFVEEIGQINARGISNVIVAYNPEIDKYLAPPKIIITPLKENVTLLGAAALVFCPPKK